MFLANKLNKGGSLSTPDAQFNYVTMLLHGDGTNGAQNNTFLDSSTNNFTITRNGNTTQGSFSPYGSNWSNYFNGTSSVSFPSNSAFAFDTGAYTVEMWVFVTGVGSNGYSHFFNAGNATGSFGFAIYSDYSLNVFGYGTGGVIAGSANDITPNQWQHIAVCRSSTSSNATKIYVNGVLKTTGTDSTNWTVTTTPSVGGLTSLSGYSTVGYISNCRVVKGTAVYTSAFTPSTTPLTAISGTSLLTCQSNRFIDNSSNAFTTTVNGTPSVQRFNPFGASTAYSTSVIGGSGYFDGSGDYLSIPNTSNLHFGSGDFTIECWVYANSLDSYNAVFAEWPDDGGSANNSYTLETVGSNMEFYWAAGTTLYGPATLGTIQTKQWTHYVICRSGNTLYPFKNGVLGTTTSITQTLNSPTSAVTIGGAVAGGGSWNGYISDVRIIKGTALYTSSFTPPTAPLTAISNTQLLCNMINGAIYDNAMMNDLETVGNAQISTSVVKYGTGSLAFDGTGDALIGQNTPNISLSGDFTIEAWVYQTSAGQNAPQICFGDAANSGTFLLYISTGQQLAYYINGTSTGSGGTAAINTWHHIAMVRSGSTITTYLNGVSQNTVTASTTFSGVPYFGAALFSGTIYYGAGYMDDLRITKGYARYTSTFTPPTRALSDIGPT